MLFCNTFLAVIAIFRNMATVYAIAFALPPKRPPNSTENRRFRRRGNRDTLRIHHIQQQPAVASILLHHTTFPTNKYAFTGGGS